MKDKTLLHILTILGMAGWSVLFRKGSIKDWFLIYLCKVLITTLIDAPVTKKKYVKYPKRYFPNSYNSNITFVYIIFPLLCVIYNQFTYKIKPVKTILSVFLFSIPMTILESVLEKNTQLVKYAKGWNWFYTFFILTLSFWIVRLFIACLRVFEQRTNDKETKIRKTNEPVSPFLL